MADTPADNALASAVRALFAPGGAIAQATPDHYSVRPSQIDMATQIANALEHSGELIAEAGTGTGKTFAYLAPAMLFGGKTLISTGTKTLQDQLFYKDIPKLRSALGVGVACALLKGRANYVCHYHLKRALEYKHFDSREQAREIQKIAQFVARGAAGTGDKQDCEDVHENSTAWRLAVSTRENCLGSDCPDFSECFLVTARKQALRCDIIVVNHHLFFADIMLRSSGMAELLPDVHAVIFDEAHLLPELAETFFGLQLSSAQVIEWLRDLRTEILVNTLDLSQLLEKMDAISVLINQLRPNMNGTSTRVARERLIQDKSWLARLETLHDEFSWFKEQLTRCVDASEGLPRLLERLQTFHEVSRTWLSAEGVSQFVCWLELFGQQWFRLHATPVDCATPFRAYVTAKPRALVYTSATLSAMGDFSLYQQKLGLEQAPTQHWPSPFDYAQQSVLFCPEHLPEPNDPTFLAEFVAELWPLLEASQGRAFVLTTSLRAMHLVHEALEARIAKANHDWLLLLQGEAGKLVLLDQFKQHASPILVATQSFWEGVDVPGAVLSLVAIDKLPFTPPDDPVLEARMARMRQEGLNPFFSLQLPAAIIAIRQGAGRLIRSEHDHGVLMIGDRRLITKSYGRKIWRSLPAMRRTRQASDAIEFLRTACPAN